MESKKLSGEPIDTTNQQKHPKDEFEVQYKISGTIKNTTGNTLQFVDSHDWEGDIDGGSYRDISNNVEISFAHSGPRGSSAAVVYQEANTKPTQFWMFAWKKDSMKTCTYTEIGSSKDTWDAWKAAINKSNSTTSWFNKGGLRFSKVVITAGADHSDLKVTMSKYPIAED